MKSVTYCTYCTYCWKLAALTALGAGLPVAWAHEPLPFDVKLLAVDANEGCDIGDIDGDGRLDVVAGRNWYHNGDWTPRPVRVIEDVGGYARSNGDFLLDVDRDGRLDVVAGEFFGPGVCWYENPGPQKLAEGILWERHELADTGLSTNEFSMMHDLDADGSPEWITNSWSKDAPLVVWRLVPGGDPAGTTDLTAEPARSDSPPRLVPHVVGQDHNGHGMGFGDVNNDGREDILVGTGWYARPAAGPFSGLWEFHPDWDRPLSCPVIVRDIDGDGRSDIIWGNPHDYGLFVWFGCPAGPDGKTIWREEAVDTTYSQLHCIELADLDGDGRSELITGKRARAHNGHDPGGSEPPLVCYYELGSDGGGFQRHDIARGAVGIGLQIRTADLDADGDIDIVVAGKDGTQILFNRLAEQDLR